MQDQLNAIITKYCETIEPNVHVIGRLLGEAAQGISEPLTAIRQAEALTHQLKGSSGTAGFVEIAEAATALDNQLKKLCQNGASSEPGAIDTVSELYRSLEQLARIATPTSSSLYSGPN
jgi:HPt (histidine-containing phosphotransfer) domain-containing protein